MRPRWSKTRWTGWRTKGSLAERESSNPGPGLRALSASSGGRPAPKVAQESKAIARIESVRVIAISIRVADREREQKARAVESQLSVNVTALPAPIPPPGAAYPPA